MEESIGSNRRIAKNTLFLYIRMGVSMLISLYTARIVLATLGDIDYGIFNVVTGCVAMFTFLNGALSGSASRFITYDLGFGSLERLKKTFSATVVVHLFLAIIIVILCETIGLWFLENKLVIPADRMHSARIAYQLSIAMIVSGMIQVPYGALIIAHEKMDVYAYMSFLDIGLRLGMILLLEELPGDKLVIWSWMILSVSIIYTSLYIAYGLRKFPEAKIIIHRETPLYKRLLSYAWWDLIGQISGMLQGQGINMLLNMFFGPIVNAARGISYQVLGALNQFSSNFTVATKPQIIKLYAAGQIKEMMNLVKVGGCMAFYLSWLFTLPLCLELEFVLRLWLGKFPDYTVTFCLLTLLTGLIVSIKSSRVSAIHATGKIKLTNIVVGLILCSSFPLVYIAFKMGFDPYSALWITFFVTLLGEVAAINILRRYINFSVMNYWISVYGRCFIVSLVSAVIPVAIHCFMHEGFLRLSLVSLASLISIGGTVFLIGFDKIYRRQIWHLISSRFPSFSFLRRLNSK